MDPDLRVGQPSVLVTRWMPPDYLPTFPNIDIRSRVFARGFDTSTGPIVNEAADSHAPRNERSGDDDRYGAACHT